MFIIRTQDDLYLATFLCILWVSSIIAWVFYAIIVFAHCKRNPCVWALSPLVVLVSLLIWFVR